VTTEEDRAWVKTLPLLFLGGVLFAFGTIVFWNKGDTTASIASMTLGVVLMTTWMITAVIDWWEAHRRRKRRTNGGEGTDGR
jgi:RsiW-degrading membrane proteinase PrsW (M82 family)